LDNAFYVFLRFFDMTLQKNVKSRVFWIFKKNVKNVFSNYVWENPSCCLRRRFCTTPGVHRSDRECTLRRESHKTYVEASFSNVHMLITTGFFDEQLTSIIAAARHHRDHLTSVSRVHYLRPIQSIQVTVNKINIFCATVSVYVWLL